MSSITFPQGFSFFTNARHHFVGLILAALYLKHDLSHPDVKGCFRRDGDIVNYTLKVWWYFIDYSVVGDLKQKLCFSGLLRQIKWNENHTLQSARNWCLWLVFSSGNQWLSKSYTFLKRNANLSIAQSDQDQKATFSNSFFWKIYVENRLNLGSDVCCSHWE